MRPTKLLLSFDKLLPKNAFAVAMLGNIYFKYPENAEFEKITWDRFNQIVPGCYRKTLRIGNISFSVTGA